MNEVATINSLAEIPIGPRGLQMRSAGDLMMFIRALRAAGMAPDNKGENDLLIRAHYGMSLGLDPMRAVQSIYVVRNRPCVWGAAIPGLILASGKCKRWEVTLIGKAGTDSYGVQVVTERHDVAGVNTFQFTMADARGAGLLGKDTWKSYPADMMRWKAIGRAATSVFGDVLYGLSIVENERDIEDAEVIHDDVQVEAAPAPAPVPVVTPAPAPAPAEPAPTPPPTELIDRFKAACTGKNLNPRDELEKLCRENRLTLEQWAQLPPRALQGRCLELEPVKMKATSQDPSWLEFKAACDAAGLVAQDESVALMTANDVFGWEHLPADVVHARIAELTGANAAYAC